MSNLDLRKGRLSEPRDRFRQAIYVLIFICIIQIMPVGWTQARQQDGVKPQKDEGVHQTITRDGITVEFSLTPSAGTGGVMDGQNVEATFRITDSGSGNPISGIGPVAWIDPVREDFVSDAKVCREKVQSYMRGSMRARPEIDLNTFYVLALNNEANISVIDPLLGFGGSKLLALVMLKSPGEDWALAKDRLRLFVTQPKSNQVAVVDTTTWKVIRQIDVGMNPVRILYQPDEKYLWVGNDVPSAGERSGVTVIDSSKMAVAAHIKTGPGHHEILVSPDDRFVFVTNRDEATVSVIDVQKLARIKDIPVGEQPVSIAYSTLSKSVYVASEKSGTVTVIDPLKHEVAATIQANPGLSVVRFDPSGRWGVLANREKNEVLVFDASNNKFRNQLEIQGGPDQITFTDEFAYVRAAGSEHLNLLRLSTFGKNEPIDVVHAPGGQLAPAGAEFLSVADSIVSAPEPKSSLIANPADGVIYYYNEGMAAPMGNFQNYRRQPRAVMVVDRSLREKSPGIYSTNIRFTHPGAFEVSFMIDSPRVFNCFNFTVKPNPAIEHKDQTIALRIEPMVKNRNVKSKAENRIQFRVIDTATRKPRPDLKDVQVLTMLAPGVWQKRELATSIGDGIYEVAFTPPESGAYYLFFECPSLNVRFQQIPYLILRAD